MLVSLISMALAEEVAAAAAVVDEVVEKALLIVEMTDTAELYVFAKK